MDAKSQPDGPDPFASRAFRVALRASGWVFAVALTLALLDLWAGVRLPQPFRLMIPWAMVGSAALGITLLVGALGTPSRRRRDD